MKYLTTVCILALVVYGCWDKNPRPTIKDVKENFISNQIYFDELSSLACDLGLTEPKFGNGNDQYTYSSKVDQTDRIPNLDALLEKTGLYAINYRLTNDGKCELSLGYYVTGFAGSGVKINYYYQKETPLFSEDSKLSYNEVFRSKRRVEFDIQLAPNWYLYFRRS